MNGAGIVERAFQLANEGKTIDELRTRMSREGYSRQELAAHLEGRHLRGCLRKLALEARRAEGLGLGASSGSVQTKPSAARQIQPPSHVASASDSPSPSPIKAEVSSGYASTTDRSSSSTALVARLRSSVGSRASGFLSTGLRLD